jgi:Response regulator containing a CheY-like receiver domain and an HTH DNA-binding domain
MGIVKNCNFKIDDNCDDVRNGISLLTKELFLRATISDYENFEQIFKVLKVVKINVLLLDLNSHEEGISNIIESIRNIQPKIKILMCTGIDENITDIKYFESGASQYVHMLRGKQEIQELLNCMAFVVEHVNSNMKKRIANFVLSIQKEAA